MINTYDFVKVAKLIWKFLYIYIALSSHPVKIRLNVYQLYKLFVTANENVISIDTLKLAIDKVRVFTVQIDRCVTLRACVLIRLINLSLPWLHAKCTLLNITDLWPSFPPVEPAWPEIHLPLSTAHQNQPQRTSSLRIEECSSTLSKSSSSGTSRSRSKSSSTSISTLSPPSDVGEPINAESTENPATHQAAIATLPEVHYERLNSIEQTAQVTEILNPRGSSSAPAPAPEPPRTRSKLHPDNFFNSYLAELRSLSAATSTISTELPRRNHLATSQSASSLVSPAKQQKQYGRRHHRSSYLQLLP